MASESKRLGYKKTSFSRYSEPDSLLIFGITPDRPNIVLTVPVVNMLQKLFFTLAAAALALAAVNEPCYGSGGRAGQTHRRTPRDLVQV